MDLEKLEKLANLVLRDLSEARRYTQYYGLEFHPDLKARVKNLLTIATETLPEHKDLFITTYREAEKTISSLSIDEACSVIRHLLEILKIEKASETKIKEMKVFESAEEKLKQANLSFQKEDYSSTLHNLSTALELILKDKVGIPTTITKINTSRIIDILVKHKAQIHPYLSEAKKHIVRIDNKTKHQGYSPSKIDCINGMKVMEELIAKLRDKEIELSEEVRNKIYEGL